MPGRRPSTRGASGFTLLELMIVVTILGIVASIGLPQYSAALRTARVGKARHELVTIATAVDAYTASHDGRLPLTLYQVGFGGKRDPWGVPYCYLNYGDGTGDGLDWAIAAGIVDPGALAPIAGGAGGGDGGDAPQDPPAEGATAEDAVGGGVAAGIDRVTIGQRIGRELSDDELLALNVAASNHGNFALFTAVPTEEARRRDRYLFPLNTDYDLFSLGPDGRTAASLGETIGLDDVIRANNGGYFGPASEY